MLHGDAKSTKHFRYKVVPQLQERRDTEASALSISTTFQYLRIFLHNVLLHSFFEIAGDPRAVWRLSRCVCVLTLLALVSLVAHVLMEARGSPRGASGCLRGPFYLIPPNMRIHVAFMF